MTSSQTTTAGAVPAARSGPDARPAAPLPGRPFPLPHAGQLERTRT